MTSFLSGMNLDLCGAGVGLKIFEEYINGEEKKMEEALGGIFKDTPMFALTEEDLNIQYRSKLGEGAFCTVYPCHIRSRATNTFNESLPPFALKRLRRDLEGMELNEAYEDLRQEAAIMRGIKHNNLVPLIGMSEQKDDIPKNKLFIVVEKLESTLDKKLEKWHKILGPMKKMTPKDTVKLRLEEVVLGIAEGLGFMHSKRVMYRDLKPGNVGFTYSGTVKIFDFGLAVRLSEGTKLQGKAGTVRYMAPEISRNKPYDLSADVFSFAVLLWQIITSRTPFEKEIPKLDFGPPKVIPEGKRPNLKYVENQDIGQLLEVCWAENPSQRWNFDNITMELRRIVEQMESSPTKKKKSSRGIKLSTFKIN
uniref:Protein kinase domain-containing protein n=1 Tax=Ditylum brightwellii TaxID=49249 RepID=A0A7S4VFL1_9STRA